jgi:arabinofuranosyltransferase
VQDDAYPVATEASVGVLGWVLPHVNIIDRYGLNDYVIARNQQITGDLMAHFRSPPPGYLECFRPNVAIRNGHVTILPRDVPLTADDIRRCEETFKP